MDEKNKSKTPLEEFKKLANDFRDVVTELGDILAKILPDIEIPEEEEEDTWKMKYPYEEGEKYWVLYDDGTVNLEAWLEYGNECNTFNQGNAFQTKEEAELESKRRNLLTRFRAFRDECNGDWKPDWSNRDKKWEISYETEEEFKAFWSCVTNSFSTFGYFKNEQDAQRAIDLFGDEIKELFVEGE